MATSTPISAGAAERAVPQMMFGETFVGMADSTNPQTKISREAHAATDKDFKRRMDRMKRQAQEANKNKVKPRSKAEVQQRLDQATHKADGSGLVDTSNNKTLEDLHKTVPPLEKAIRDYVDPNGGGASDEIVQKIIKRLEGRPDLQELLTEASLYENGELPDEIAKKYADHILNDPEFKTILRTNHDVMFTDDYDVTADPMKAKSELDAANAKHSILTEDQKAAQGELDETRNQLKEYERDKSGKPIGTKAREVDDAKRDLPQAKQGVEQARRQLKIIEDDLTTVLSDRRKADSPTYQGTLDERIKRTQEQIGEAEKRLSEKLQEQRNLQDKIDTEDTLRRRETTLDKEVKTLNVEVQSSQTEVDRLEASFKTAERDFAAQQQKILEGFDTVVEQSVEEWANRHQIEAANEVEAFLTNKIVEDKKIGEDARAVDLDLLLQQLRKKLTKSVVKFFKSPNSPPVEIGRKMDKNSIKRAYEILFTKGDDALVDHVFAGHRPPLDGDQRDNIKSELVRQIMRMHKLSGGTISDIDRQFLSLSKWGREFVTEMMQRDPALASELTKAAGVDPSDPDAADKVQKRLGIDPHILMLLLGVVGQAGAAPAEERR